MIRSAWNKPLVTGMFSVLAQGHRVQAPLVQEASLPNRVSAFFCSILCHPVQWSFPDRVH
jgi:hypothetical protein